MGVDAAGVLARQVQSLHCPCACTSRLCAPGPSRQGTNDEVIDISCGQKLASLIKEKWRYPPLWAQVRGRTWGHP